MMIYRSMIRNVLNGKARALGHTLAPGTNSKIRGYAFSGQEDDEIDYIDGTSNILGYNYSYVRLSGIWTTF
jgi:hypothetical protein